MPASLDDAKQMLSLASANQDISNDVSKPREERIEAHRRMLHYINVVGEILGEFLVEHADSILSCAALFACAGAAWFWGIALWA